MALPSLGRALVSLSFVALPLGAVALAGGCGDLGLEGDDPFVGASDNVVALFAAAPLELSGPTFFDHPFPSDLRRDEGGKVVLAGWPTGRASILELYVDAVKGQLDGFSPVAAGFLRFSGPLDPASLPADPGESVLPTSTVQLLDIDPSSPEHGQRRPVRVQFRADEGVYFPSNLLQFMPAFGFPLRPHTRYALVVTDQVQGALERVSVADELAEALSDSGALAAVGDELEAAGIGPGTIVHLAAFTTNDPTEELARTAAALPSQIEAPTARPAAWVQLDTDPDYLELGGVYGPSPNYQVGTVPYAEYGDGGGLELDGAGVAQVQDTFDPRFSLMVPNPTLCPMPAAGYPIALYAHGTFGDYRSYRQDGTGPALAKKCIATMGVDQIFHGTRPGAPENEAAIQLLFFNFQNPDAARTNLRQSALDEVQRARLFTESAMEVPAALSPTGQPIRFDPTKILFFGHSQGALNGPLYLAVADTARGGVLSGASSVFTITLLEKTEPSPSVAGLVTGVFLGLKGEETLEVDLFHPALALAQTIEDPVDAIHYARLLTREPLGSAKSVLLTEGIAPDGGGDSYAPPRGCEALAMAAGLPIQEPVVRMPPDAAWGGLERVALGPEGLAGNLAQGAASGVLAQWTPRGSSDGHFVVFDVPEAKAQAAQFLRNLADEPAGRVPAP